MEKKMKPRRVGTSLDSTVPTEMARTPGKVQLTRHDPDFEVAMDAGRDFMRRYPDAMKKLAGG